MHYKNNNIIGVVCHFDLDLFNLFFPDLPTSVPHLKSFYDQYHLRRPKKPMAACKALMGHSDTEPAQAVILPYPRLLSLISVRGRAAVSSSDGKQVAGRVGIVK